MRNACVVVTVVVRQLLQLSTDFYPRLASSVVSLVMSLTTFLVGKPTPQFRILHHDAPTLENSGPPLCWAILRDIFRLGERCLLGYLGGNTSGFKMTLVTGR